MDIVSQLHKAIIHNVINGLLEGQRQEELLQNGENTRTFDVSTFSLYRFASTKVADTY